MQDPGKAERLRLLAGRPILRGLPGALLQEIDAALESVQVRGGAQVVRRGDDDVPFILVVQGGLRASFVDDDHRRRVVFESFRGATVGEALVLSGQPSPLDLHAIRDSHLLCLPRDTFNTLALRHPELAVTFARAVTARLVEHMGSRDVLASLSRKTDRLPRSVALLCIGGDEVRRLRSMLTDALSKSRTTTRLGLREARDVTESKVGLETSRDFDRLRAWLGELEDACELLIFECDLTDRNWSDFCLRQADRILVIIGDDLPSRGKPLDWWHEGKLGERPAHVELAVVHDRWHALPRGGTTYAELPGVARIHHVKADELAGAERLARWLLDRPVGLVLGGGGARGIAHVGVVKALEEARVPIDIVGGTSMGAIFAGGLARGWSADRMMSEVRALFSSRFALYDPTLPVTSLLAGKKLDRVMRRFFEDLSIADLWIPFFCIATNISHPGAEVHESGRLRDAIRASCSVPGLFPPYRAVEQLLVDGGLVDNVPIDVMGERCRGPVIAVDVFSSRRHDAETNESWSSGPHLFEIMMRATFVGSQRTTEMSLFGHPPALYLVPPLRRFGMLEWGAYQAIFQAGYVCAKRALEAGRLPRSLWAGRVEDAASVGPG